MNTISSPTSPLAGALSGLAAPTPPPTANDPCDAAPGASGAPDPAAPDVLSLSGPSSDEGRLAAAQDVERQNQYSTLTDFPAALKATQAATAALAANPPAALAAVGGVDAGSVLSLTQEG
jgi:hypothetical protein